MDGFLITDFEFTAHKKKANGYVNLNASHKTCKMLGPSLASTHSHVGRLEPGTGMFLSLELSERQKVI
jgi:hypothetical protein